MADESQGDATYLIALPAYALTKFATRDSNSGALELCAESDFFTSRTEDGVCLALFTDVQAAESYRDGRNLAAGFEVTRLDSLDLLCVLSRMGEVCQRLAVDMCATNVRGRLVGMEWMRQTLLASVQALLPAAEPR
jgi:hypothetical protein